MFKNLLPKTTDFFKFFEQHSNCISMVCKELYNLSFSERKDFTKFSDSIKRIESEADVITHTCTDELRKTFITPLDRSDILSLIKNMDDIIDSIYSVSERIISYEIDELRIEFRELSGILKSSSEHINECIYLLRDMKNAKLIHNHCISIHELEDRADIILRSAISKLFKEEKNAIEIIKWKEIYQRLEKATDHCDSVSNIIEKVIIESA